MKKIATISILLFSISISICIQPASASSDPIESIYGIFDPAVGVKRVEFLPSGHLHKNKPRYKKFDPVVVETSYFKIYMYGLDNGLEGLYESETKKASEELSRRTGVNHFTEKIRIAIYNTAKDFQETNLIFEIITDGLGGSTEITKRKRIVIAFRDSVKGFRQLLRHELAHRYHVELLDIGFWEKITRELPPLWFIEGAAQQFAHPLDMRSALIVRDAYLHGHLAHATDSFWHPALVYTQGEYTLHYLAERYKDKGDVITQIFAACKKIDFGDAFKKVTGETLEEFDLALHRHIEKEFTAVRAKDDITDKTKPVMSATLLAARGPFFVTQKNKFGREELRLNWTDGNLVRSKKLADDGRLSQVSLRGFPIEISPEFGFREHGASFISTNTVVYAVDRGDKDVIVVHQFSLHPKKKKIKLLRKEVYEVEGVREVMSPVAVDSHTIAFVGRTKVFGELYTLDRESGKVTQLTSARRSFRGLTYTPGRHTLVTSVENEQTNSYDLAEFHLDKKTLTYLTETPENEFSAVSNASGTALLYVSDKGSAHNIYRYDLDAHQINQLTDVRIGVFRPQWFGDNGLMFNAYENLNLTVRSALLPSTGTAVISTPPASPPISNAIYTSTAARFLTHIPMAHERTFFDVIFSSDHTKALFLENRTLSMEPLKGKDLKIRFHLVDLTAGSTISFTLGKFSKMKHLGNISFLADSRILLQRSDSYREKVEHTDDSGRKTYVEIDRFFREAFIYNPNTSELKKIDYEAFDGRMPLHISPDQTRLFWHNNDSLFVYDISKHEKSKHSQEFSDLQDAEFLSETEIVALDKKWDLTLHRLTIGTSSVDSWKIIDSKEWVYTEQVSWRLVPAARKVFFIASLRNQEKRYRVDVFDIATGSRTSVYPEISAITNEKIEGGTLVLETRDLYQNKKIIRIDSNGHLTELLEKSSVQPISSTTARELGPVLPREFPASLQSLKRYRQLSKFPKPYYAIGAAGIGIDNRGVGSYILLEMLALDELNDKAFVANIYLQNETQGLADIQYYDFNRGFSYTLDYWNFGRQREKLSLGISKNNFLHMFKNWDINLREEYTHANYYGNSFNVLRTKLGTSYSIDTTVGDWHGPHSGVKFYSEIETGMDKQTRYQSTDLNLDARYYLPITERSGLAFRTAGGQSFGPNPTLFLWGGNKTFRGTSFDGQAGNAYALQSSELRFPLLDAAGAKLSGPIGDIFQLLTIYMDVRGGLYHDIGDIWYRKTPPLGSGGHRAYYTQQSAGAFVNIPTALGINVRFSQSIWWNKQFNFWLGYNW